MSGQWHVTFTGLPVENDAHDDDVSICYIVDIYCCGRCIVNQSVLKYQTETMKTLIISILLLLLASFSFELSEREIQPNAQNEAVEEGKADDDHDANPGGSKASTKTTPSVQVQAPTKPVVLNSTGDCINGSNCGDVKSSLMNTFTENKDMLMRTFYVLLGVTSIVILYFVFRAWR